ncbi:NAD(P)-binding protein [Exidia glandulosa HHB12029]|uniref:NAD(P)-binding protein n=1 Tax=Exidia glandulosa HHB12029 TaxID=1314781 RepID=A0A165JHW7_EXIGL|nr:NAD(P)-binding protein [Exidia glandulosa HHB12029]
MSIPIRVGFIGLSTRGWAASTLAPPILSVPLSSKYTLTAVSTTNATSASASAEKYTKETGRTVKPYHGDAANIVGDDEVDLIVVAVKVPDHGKVARTAIEKGKDVFVEWPLGNGLQETLELAEAAKRKGVRTLVGLQGWQSPAVVKAREWVASGKIGRVLSATWVSAKLEEFTLWAPFTTQTDVYAADPSNVVVGHHLSAITRILGPVESISATSSKVFDSVQVVDAQSKPTGETLANRSPDQWAASGLLKNHPGALFSGTWRSGVSVSKETDKDRPTLVFIIDGDKGFIKFESSSFGGSIINMFVPEKVYLNGEEVKVEDTVGTAHRNWEAYASGAEGEYATFDDAVDLYKHLDAISTSASEGRVVSVGV